MVEEKTTVTSSERTVQPDTTKLGLVVIILAIPGSFAIIFMILNKMGLSVLLTLLISFVVDIYVIAILSRTRSLVALKLRVQKHPVMDRLLVSLGQLLSPLVLASLIALTLAPIVLLLATGSKDTPNWLGTVTASILVLGIFFLDKRAANRDREANQRQTRETQATDRYTELTETLAEALATRTAPTDRSAASGQPVAYYLYHRSHVALTKFVNLWSNFKTNPMMRLHGRLEFQIGAIGNDLTNIAAESETVLPPDDVQQIKEVGFDLTALGGWRGYLGDNTEFTNAGESLCRKAQALREKIGPKLAQKYG